MRNYIILWELMSKEKIKKIKIHCSDTSSTTTDVSEDPSNLGASVNYPANVKNT